MIVSEFSDNSSTLDVQSQNSTQQLSVLNIDEYLKLNGFNITFNPPKDGNCQFASIAYELNRTNGNDEATNSSIRQCITEYLSRENDNKFDNSMSYYRDFVSRDKIPPTWDTYLKDMSKNRTFGDHITLQAAAKIFNVQILILSHLGRSSTVLISPKSRDTHRFDDIDHSLPLFLLGHAAEGHGEHYCCAQADDKETLQHFLLQISESSSSNRERQSEV